MIITWPYAFLVLALVAAVLGFTSIAGDPVSIARPLAVIFLILFPAGLAYRSLTGKQILGR